MPSRRAILAAIMALPVAACGRPPEPPGTSGIASGPAEINAMIEEMSRRYDVPPALVHRVVQRESGYDPGAQNGSYYGLMQISPQTARAMGYRGEPAGLLDARTNLTYAVKYLRGAWLVSDGDYDEAVMWYARGYYYEAKRRGLLEETGLKG